MKKPRIKMSGMLFDAMRRVCKGEYRELEDSEEFETSNFIFWTHLWHPSSPKPIKSPFDIFKESLPKAEESK